MADLGNKPDQIHKQCLCYKTFRLILLGNCSERNSRKLACAAYNSENFSCNLILYQN